MISNHQNPNNSAAEDLFRTSEAQAMEIAERAAAKAVRDTFRLLGTDIAELGDVNNLRDDFRFIRRQRALVEFRHTETSKSIIAALMGAAMGLLISAITWLATSLRHTS